MVVSTKNRNNRQGPVNAICDRDSLRTKKDECVPNIYFYQTFEKLYFIYCLASTTNEWNISTWSE